MNFHNKGYVFYNRYINTEDYIYIDDDVTCIKPKHNYTNTYREKNRSYGSNSYRFFHRLWLNVKRKREHFGGEIKPTGFIYLTVSKFRQAESDLKLISCLHDAVINAAQCIGKFINKN